VIISDVVDPFTGDLDGAEIRVDHAVSIQEAVFIIAHLFGHTVQWNTSERARAIGLAPFVKNPTTELLEELEGYEREACCYSLQLFHEAGVGDLDQWLSDFAACDFAYLRHFYVHGKKAPFESFWQDDQPLLEPRVIPPFQPVRWMSRWSGTVV
jgi:hypothetical protein